MLSLEPAAYGVAHDEHTPVFPMQISQEGIAMDQGVHQ